MFTLLYYYLYFTPPLSNFVVTLNFSTMVLFRSVTRIIDMCQPFMEMDALLIWTLLSLCNVTHYSYIMEKYHKSTPVISEHLASYPSVCSQNPEVSINFIFQSNNLLHTCLS